MTIFAKCLIIEEELFERQKVSHAKSSDDVTFEEAMVERNFFSPVFLISK